MSPTYGILRKVWSDNMRVLLQRVKHASVKVDGNIVGSIPQGFLLLVGITSSDTE